MADPVARRPSMNPDYGVPAELPETVEPFDTTRRKLATARNYWVSTASIDGGPHVAPVWGLWVDDEFWFSTDARSVKGRNIGSDPRVAVHLESGDDVVIVTGTASPIEHGSEVARRFVELYEPKYDMEFPDPLPAAYALWRVVAERVSVWTEASFVDSAIRWDMP